MQKLLRFVVLITIVLLNCSTSWSQSDAIHFSTGELVEDSVLIPYSALKEANAKMVELKYQKTINQSLQDIIDNDRIIISNLSSESYVLKKENKVVKRERNILAGTSIFLIVAILFII